MNNTDKSIINKHTFFWGGAANMIKKRTKNLQTKKHKSKKQKHKMQKIFKKQRNKATLQNSENK